MHCSGNLVARKVFSGMFTVLFPANVVLLAEVPKFRHTHIRNREYIKHNSAAGKLNKHGKLPVL
jgi:hypothetical protein